MGALSEQQVREMLEHLEKAMMRISPAPFGEIDVMDVAEARGRIRAVRNMLLTASVAPVQVPTVEPGA